MITREQLDAMSPEEKTAVFESLVARSGMKWGEVAERIGTSRRGVENWRARHIVPDTAIFTLSAWVDGAGAATDDLADIAHLLDQAATALLRVTQLVERMAKRRSG